MDKRWQLLFDKEIALGPEFLWVVKTAGREVDVVPPMWRFVRERCSASLAKCPPSLRRCPVTLGFAFGVTERLFLDGDPRDRLRAGGAPAIPAVTVALKLRGAVGSVFDLAAIAAAGDHRRLHRPVTQRVVC
jgi:hypothetical protein